MSYLEHQLLVPKIEDNEPSEGGLLPTAIPDLDIWLDAGDISTLYQDSGKTTPVTTDADVIGAWADKSGNGNDALQATTALKPTYRVAQANGRAVIRGDGTDDYLSITGLSADATQTIIIVAKEEAAAGDNTAAWGYNASAYLRLLASNNWAYHRDEAMITVNLSENYTTYKALAFRYASTSSLTYESNVGNVQTFDPDDAYSVITTLGLFARSSGGGISASVNIAEFIRYTRTISDTELAGLMIYLRGRWGLAA